MEKACLLVCETNNYTTECTAIMWNKIRYNYNDNAMIIWPKTVMNVICINYFHGQ